MNKDIAQKLLDQIMVCYEALEKAERLAEKLEDQPRVTITKGILVTVGELEDSLLTNIVREHPDLNPFSEKRPRTF